MPVDLVPVEVVAQTIIQAATPAEMEAPGWWSFITDGVKNNQFLDYNENLVLARIDLSL
jgi:hypothetical protein